MRTPAGLPCRVMRISSDSASRRKRDRSSLISASATRRIGLAEPARRLGFRDDREDFDDFERNVMKDSYLPDPQPVLWLAKTSQPFDTALAGAGRLIPQVPFQSVAHLGSSVGR